MFSGAHIMVFTKDAAADRAFFRDVLGLPCIDGGGGGGWLIFGLPRAECGFHPAGEVGETPADMFLMTDDLQTTLARLREKGVTASDPTDQGWGIASRVTLPSGGTLGIYQPRHARPPAAG